MLGNKIQLLFLCTGNSCRSQMAEGLCCALRGNLIDAYSAGIEQYGLNPLAVQVMQEIDIDISAHYSKTVLELGDKPFDYVISVCGHANEHCPFFPAVTRIIHQGFDDPPRLAAAASSEDEALAHYRRVRDEIKAYILQLPEALPLGY